MPFGRQFLGAFVGTSLFFLGATTLATNTIDRDSAEYSFSTQYAAESHEDPTPRYSPV